MIAFISFIGLSIASPERNDDTVYVYKDVSTLNFDLYDIEAKITKPTGMTIDDRKKAIFNPLLELRPDFNVELKTSIDSIR